MAWAHLTSRRVDVRRRLQGALLTMGGMRLAQCFYWWLALAQYLRHMGGSFEAIQGKVGGRGGVWGMRLQAERHC